ncbi:hypothetical protein GGR63_001628 [Xanthomonas sp. 3272]|uniref:hypothetical protein n=1 Tax=Xanthomonas arboricola TaxID=56448 RepID=UPI00142FF22F|nr:hypothetical protein [Xanthomonas arboricola]NJC01741.1 hypothetical protein [Xanthomonas arboricola]
MKGPSRVYLSVAGLLLGVTCAAQAAPVLNPVCLDRDEFIAAGREQGDVLFKVMYDPANPQSLTTLLKPEHEKMAATLQKAQAGDAESAAQLGKLWAECLLDGIAYSDAKKTLIEQFLQIARRSGDKQAASYLGLFAMRGLSGGTPSLVAAVPLFIEAGSLDAGVHGSSAASGAYALALAYFIPKLVTPSIVVATRGKTPHDRDLRFSVNYRFCPLGVSVDEVPPPAVHNPALVAALSTPLQWLPTDGLDCEGINDLRGVRLPLTFPATAPAKNSRQ